MLDAAARGPNFGGRLPGHTPRGNSCATGKKQRATQRPLTPSRSPSAAVERLQARIARLNEREADISRLMAASASSNGFPDQHAPSALLGTVSTKSQRSSSPAASTKPTRVERNVSGPSHFSMRNETSQVGSQAGCSELITGVPPRLSRRMRSQSPRSQPLQSQHLTPQSISTCTSDVLAPVDRALQELRQAMATLPVSGAESSFHTPAANITQQSSQHLSSAEVGLVKAMEKLDAHFADCTPKRLWPAVTPPRSRGLATEALPSPDLFWCSASSSLSPVSASSSVPHRGPTPTNLAMASRSPASAVSPSQTAAWAAPSQRLAGSQSSASALGAMSPHVGTVKIGTLGHERSAQQGSVSSRSPPREHSDLVSPSLASSLLAFSPPAPTAQEMLAAALAQVGAELEVLAEAAHCAAAVCPQCAPLVEALCAAVSDELAQLKLEQTSAASGATPHAKSAFDLGCRVSVLRSATAEGLESLQAALRTCSAEEETRKDNFGKRHSLGSSSMLNGTNSLSSLLHSGSRGKDREVAKMFGDVACNMRRAVQEIRDVKARQAEARNAGLSPWLFVEPGLFSSTDLSSRPDVVVATGVAATGGA